MKSIWLQEKNVGGEFLGEKYMAARKVCHPETLHPQTFLETIYFWVESSWVKSIWFQEKFVGGEFLGKKYMVSRKNCGWRVSG